MARLGMARHGEARLGLAGSAWLGGAGWARSDLEEIGAARRGEAGADGQAWPGKAR